MNILFLIEHAGYVRNFESVLRALAGAGHAIHLGFDQDHSRYGEMDQVAELTRQYPGITHDFTPVFGIKDERAWQALAFEMRRLRDYLRYLTPAYTNAGSLRERVEVRVPGPLRGLVRAASTGDGRGLAALAALLDAVERALPLRQGVVEYVASFQPDLILVTPLVDLGSSQGDYVKAAHHLGVKSAFCMASWDNLTNKGLMRVTPDAVFVWNEMQKAEAVELHGASASHVVVTGANAFDHWFEWRPSTSRAEFCDKVGLDPSKPVLLYLGSSNFIAPDEGVFGLEWLARIRADPDPLLAEAGVLFRPHPKNVETWHRVDFSGHRNTAIWPPRGQNPVLRQSKADYFDSIYHSALVIGANTSGLIEAGIVGRPVHTVLAPRFAQGQTGTLHFRHLLNANGGLLCVAENMDAHMSQLTEALSDRSAAVEKCRRFVEAFVRPYGVDVAATPVFVSAIEDLLRAPRPAPIRAPWWAYPVRASLAPLALAAPHLRRADKRARREGTSFGRAILAILWSILGRKRAGKKARGASAPATDRRRSS